MSNLSLRCNGRGKSLNIKVIRQIAKECRSDFLDWSRLTESLLPHVRMDGFSGAKTLLLHPSLLLKARQSKV